jgi:hypothetical protein
MIHLSILKQYTWQTLPLYLVKSCQEVQRRGLFQGFPSGIPTSYRSNIDAQDGYIYPGYGVETRHENTIFIFF